VHGKKTVRTAGRGVRNTFRGPLAAAPGSGHDPVSELVEQEARDLGDGAALRARERHVREERVAFEP